MLAELPDLWDFNLGSWQNDSLTVALRQEGVAGAIRPRAEAADDASRWSASAASPRPTRWCRRSARHARLHRRGAALDRRSVPAEEDRGRPDRRHPRMHRLQHLRSGDYTIDADPLHPEPDHGRGMAARLAPGEIRAEEARTDRCWWSAPARPGSRRRWRSGSAATRCISPKRPASSAAASRAKRGCRAWPHGSACVDYRAASSSGWRTSRSSARARSTADDVLEFGFDARRRRHRRALAERRRRPLAHPADLDRRRDRRCSPPTTSWPGAQPERRAGGHLRRRPLLHGRRARRAARAERPAVTFVTPAARVSEWTVNTLEQERIQRRLLEPGLTVVPSRALAGAGDGVRTACVYTVRGVVSAPATRWSWSLAAARGRARGSLAAGPASGRTRASRRSRRRRRAGPRHDRGGGVGWPALRRAARRAAGRRRGPVPARGRRPFAGGLTLVAVPAAAAAARRLGRGLHDRAVRRDDPPQGAERVHALAVRWRRARNRPRTGRAGVRRRSPGSSRPSA